jgi:hypothetical protein
MTLKTGNRSAFLAAEACQLSLHDREIVRRSGDPVELATAKPEHALLEDFDFLLKVLDGILLVAIDPARQAKEEKLKMIHPGRIGVGLQFGQKFGCSSIRTFVGCRIFVSPERKREFSDSTRRSWVRSATPAVL